MTNLQTDQSDHVDELTVSAVICTRNRPVDLRRTLESLSWQETPCAEILVIDDSDPERPRRDRADLRSGRRRREGVDQETVPGLTASRNLAIERVTGDITIYFDDDVILRPNYMTEIVAAFEQDPELAGAGGSIDDDHVYGWRPLRALAMIPGRATGRVYPSGWSTPGSPRRSSRSVEHLIGCNMAYRTSILRRYRFNSEFLGYALGEDLEMSHAACTSTATGWSVSERHTSGTITGAGEPRPGVGLPRSRHSSDRDRPPVQTTGLPGQCADVPRHQLPAEP